jgi:hypothetical protein
MDGPRRPDRAFETAALIDAFIYTERRSQAGLGGPDLEIAVVGLQNI